MDAFNPYREFLGLEGVGENPDHYRLLGLRPDETNPQIISFASDKALAQVRSQRPGGHAAEWSRLLDEIQQAKLCLLDVNRRTAYDRQLALQGVETNARSPQHAGLQGERSSANSPAKEISGGTIAGGAMPAAASLYPPGYVPDAPKPAASASDLAPPGVAPTIASMATPPVRALFPPGSKLGETPQKAAAPPASSHPAMSPMQGYSAPGNPATGNPALAGMPALPPGALPPGAMPTPYATTPYAHTAMQPVPQQPTAGMPGPMTPLNSMPSPYGHPAASYTPQSAPVYGGPMSPMTPGPMQAHPNMHGPMSAGPMSPVAMAPGQMAPGQMAPGQMAQYPYAGSAAPYAAPPAFPGVPPAMPPLPMSPAVQPGAWQGTPAATQPAAPYSYAAPAMAQPAGPTPYTAPVATAVYAEPAESSIQVSTPRSYRRQNGSLVPLVATLVAGMLMAGAIVGAIIFATSQGKVSTVAYNAGETTTQDPGRTNPPPLVPSVDTSQANNPPVKPAKPGPEEMPRDSGKGRTKNERRPERNESKPEIKPGNETAMPEKSPAMKPAPDKPSSGNDPPVKMESPPPTKPAPEMETPAGAVSPADLAALTVEMKQAVEAYHEYNFADGAKSLAKARTLAKLPQHKEKVERFARVAELATRFRRAMEQTLGTLDAGDVLKLGSVVEVAVVEVGPNKIVLRDAGMNNTYTLDSLKMGIALKLGEMSLSPSDPETRLAKGAYEFFDRRRDTSPATRQDKIKKVESHWREAELGGANITELLKVLTDTYDFEKDKAA